MLRRRGAERFRASRGGCVESSARGWRGAAHLTAYMPIVQRRQRYQHPEKGYRHGVGRAPVGAAARDLLAPAAVHAARVLLAEVRP